MFAQGACGLSCVSLETPGLWVPAFAGTTRVFVDVFEPPTRCKISHGTIVLAGAGKMGGAMLTGWLAGGLDAKRVVVIEPHPSD